MRPLNKKQILDICYGATFLGSGGGGPFLAGKQLVESLPDNTNVTLMSVDEAAQQNTLTAVVACIGAPDDMLQLNDPSSFIYALEKLDSLVYAQQQKHIGQVIPVEVGGLNSIVPIVVAANKGLAVVDGDGAGRAVPALTMLTYAASGLSANPTVLANSKGQSVTVSVDTAPQAEAFARPILDVFGEEAGLAMWAMDGQTLEKAVPIRDTLTLAELLGQQLNPNGHRSGKFDKASLESIVTQFNESILKNYHLEMRPLFIGGMIVQPLEESTRGGFDFGRVILRNSNNYEVWIYNQNENLIAWDPQTSSPLAIAPDSICYLSASGQPFSNAGIEALDGILNEEVDLWGIVARPELQTGTILNSFQKALADLGFLFGYQPLPNLYSRRE